MFSISQTFETLAEFIQHIQLLEQVRKNREKKTMKAIGEEKRGVHMKELHRLSKEYHEANPALTRHVLNT
jgi:hypothetical protein